MILTFRHRATDELGLGKMLSAVDTALEKQEWAKAEEQIERIDDTFGRRHQIPREVGGPLLFKKGWCQLKQEKWKEAMQSFEWCYKKYPDRKKNPFQLLALRGWGDAAVGAKDPETAARMYRKYIREASNTDWDNPFKKKIR